MPIEQCFSHVGSYYAYIQAYINFKSLSLSIPIGYDVSKKNTVDWLSAL